jgi:tellurite resistance protein
MSARYTRNKPSVCKVENRYLGQQERCDELLDAVVSAAALVARAKDASDAGERAFIIDVLARNGAIARISRTDIGGAFDYRLRDVRERSGVEMALERLRRMVGRVPARLIIDTAEHVAAADGHFHQREMHALRSIRKALRAPSRSSPTSVSKNYDSSSSSS